jgi:large conductance mechanosensitive channel
MIQRLRDFFRYEPVGVSVPIGVVLGYGLFYVLGAVVSGFALPILLESNNFGGFSFTIAGVEFQYYESLVSAIALALTAALAYALLIWRRVDERETAPMRECPECLSEIDAEARRCAFCASPVEPVTAV